MKAISIFFLAGAVLLIASCDSIKNNGETRPVIDDETEEVETGTVGSPLGEWTEGTLDIHFINTGRGECSFLILPDGTTVLVDMAGNTTDYSTATYKDVDPKPNSSISSATVIINYINYFNSEQSAGHIDYALLSHFHEDHMGTYTTSLGTGGDGTFRLTSLAEIGLSLPYYHFFDRCYPDYDYPYESYFSASKYQNEQAFATYMANTMGATVEAFDAGALNQIALEYDADSYPDFQIQNLCANGYYWTGTGTEKARNMPDTFDTTDSNSLPDENHYSCGFKLTFGDFDYFSAGDLQYESSSLVASYSYLDMEAPVAAVVGQVDVAKANHHGTQYANGDDLMQAMCPTVWVANVWRDIQPRTSAVADVLEANPDCDIYCTNFDSDVNACTSSQLENFVSFSGHVVVRVLDGGSYYYVYVLDDSDMNYNISSINGPYASK